MVTSVTKEFLFCSAHRLLNYKGDCANLHGHNYRVLIEVEGGMDEESGMILDFKEVKRIGNEILDRFDHATIINPKDTVMQDICNTIGSKHFVFTDEPTAENFAKYIFSEMQNKLKIPSFVQSVTVYETPTSFAKVIHA